MPFQKAAAGWKCVYFNLYILLPPAVKVNLVFPLAAAVWGLSTEGGGRAAASLLIITKKNPKIRPILFCNREQKLNNPLDKALTN